MKNMKKVLGIAVILTAFLVLSSCNPVEDDSRSASLLIIDKIQGQDARGANADFLQSDVLLDDGSVRSDSIQVTLRAETVDPDPLLGTSSYNDIILTRYLVSFTRTDGRNTPGEDVPYPFEGSLNAVVSTSGATSRIILLLVREVAKLEPPLIRLVDVGAEVVLACTAKIELYGHDLANRSVKATGYLTVYFANYADITEQEPS